MTEDGKEQEKRPISPNRRIYKVGDIIDIYSMSRSSIYRAMEEEGFPQPIKLTSRSVGWWKHAVEEWFSSRPTGTNPCADADQYQSEAFLTSRPQRHAA